MRPIRTQTQGKPPDEGWHMKEKHENIVQKRIVYVFALLPERWSDFHQPITDVIPSRVVAEVLQISHRDWLAAPGKNGQKHNDTVMPRIRPFYKDSSAICKAGWKNIGTTGGFLNPF
jgi:hypothetical protein